MIDAKNKFREGYILIKAPFKFVKLKEPVQQHTIVWAYSEQPLLRKKLTDKAFLEIDSLIHEDTFMNSRIPFGKDPEEWRNEQINQVYSSNQSYENIYEGDIVQATVNNQTTRFYPEEYSIINSEKISTLLEEEGYHAVCSPGLYSIKSFIDKVHYLRSRGISKNIAEKWASIGYKDLVYYKPYYELLKQFSRPVHIYPDLFYEKIEGISLEKQLEYCNS